MNIVEPVAETQKTKFNPPKKEFTYKNHKKSNESFDDMVRALMRPVSIKQPEEYNVIDLSNPNVDIFTEPMTVDFDKERAKQQFLDNYR